MSRYIITHKYREVSYNNPPVQYEDYEVNTIESARVLLNKIYKNMLENNGRLEYITDEKIKKLEQSYKFIPAYYGPGYYKYITDKEKNLNYSILI